MLLFSIQNLFTKTCLNHEIEFWSLQWQGSDQAPTTRTENLDKVNPRSTAQAIGAQTQEPCLSEIDVSLILFPGSDILWVGARHSWLVTASALFGEKVCIGLNLITLALFQEVTHKLILASICRVFHRKWSLCLSDWILTRYFVKWILVS